MKNIILLNLFIIVIGLTISQSIYWFRIGDGQIGRLTVVNEITPDSAKVIAKQLRALYYPDKVYKIEEVYSTMKTRDVFPFTKVKIDSTSLTTYLHQN